jgi:hypothetical protein
MPQPNFGPFTGNFLKGLSDMCDDALHSHQLHPDIAQLYLSLSVALLRLAVPVMTHELTLEEKKTRD